MSDQIARWSPWDRPRFHKKDLDAKVYVGSGGDAWKGHHFAKEPQVAACKPYGGDCLGDGCRAWMPLPSPAKCQEGTCGLSRREQPIHLREAKRRIGQNIHVGNEAARLGWARSAQIAYQRAWAYALLVENMIEEQEKQAA
ncbi:hypothetical protein CcrBL47_gp433 [Caulobacter phage BL47]|nr:hypothetical protein CcrBL47_gp433 [Caulobacter phage BL47]